MITTSESTKAIVGALYAFQGSVHGVGRDSSNPHFKSRYASLENVCETIRPALQSVGVVFIQSPGAIVDGNMEMITRFIHAESGEWIEGKGDIPLGKRDPQGAGSAQTYAQRYHLMAMLGLPPIDDDGESAIDRENSRPAPATLPKAKSRDLYAEMQADIDSCMTLEDLGILWGSKAFQNDLKSLKQDWQNLLTDRKEERKRELNPALAPARSSLDSQFPGDRQ